MPLVRPPSDIHLTCLLHPGFESTTWTDAWNHQLAPILSGGHGGVPATWLLLGSTSTEE